MVTRVQLEGDVDLSGQPPPTEPTPTPTPESSTPAPEPSSPAPEPSSPATATIPVPRDPSLPANFNSVDDLKAAYAEAQRKITELSSKPATPATPQVGQPTPLELDRYTQEFNTFGRLSEDSIKALEQKGIPRSLTQTYIEGVSALGANQLRRGHELVGGAEQYQQMAGWASTNLTPGELHAFNAQVSSPDQGVRDWAVKSLNARWKTEAGGQPSFVRGMGSSGGGGTSEGFASEAEMTRAIQDPKYQEDAGYRAQVQRRIINTDF